MRSDPHAKACPPSGIALGLLFGVALLVSASGAEPTVPEPVRTSEWLAVDGAALYLETHGADRAAPVLLWLHGGPGSAARPLFRYFNSDLEQHFVVAYWDQRGAGRSFDPEADPRKLTIARHLADLDTVVDHLRRTFGRDEVVLIGHSWGGALGVLYARDHPSKVAAFVAVAPVVAASAGQQAEYDFVLSEATRRNDRDALERLQEIGAPPYVTPADAIALGRLTDRYGGVFHEALNRPWLVLSGIFGGLVTPWEIPILVRGTEVSLAAMYEELRGLDLPQSAPSIDVPVVFLLGRHDRHIEAGLAARYLESLRAPSKKLIWFERSAHNVPFEEPERFNDAVVDAVQSIGIRAEGSESSK